MDIVKGQNGYCPQTHLCRIFINVLIYLNVCPCVRLQLEESTKPQRLSQKLEKAVTNIYKPVANHIVNVRPVCVPVCVCLCVCLCVYVKLLSCVIYYWRGIEYKQCI